MIASLFVGFGHLERLLCRMKPSDETLKQGRNPDHGMLLLTLTLTLLTLTPSPSVIRPVRK